jgi:T-complex protein 1 subunit gamma
MSVARNVMFEPQLCPGGGATEMALSVLLSEKSKEIDGIEAMPYKALASALEVIPRTLVMNCGGNAIKTLTQLRVLFIPLVTYRPSMQMENILSESMAQLAKS